VIPGPRHMILPAIVTVVVVSAVVAAVVILGPPSLQRQRKLDEVRVQNLTYIGRSVNSYFIRHKELPLNLETLAKEQGYYIERSDPDTGKPYGYQIIDPHSYRLCADFTTESAMDSPNSYNVYSNTTWAHGQGHQCFDRSTRPDHPVALD
jgi:hypothetical protein